MVKMNKEVKYILYFSIALVGLTVIELGYNYYTLKSSARRKFDDDDVLKTDTVGE